MKSLIVYMKVLMIVSLFFLITPNSLLKAVGPHDYFDALVARPDFWKGYSLRPQTGEPITSPYYEKQLLRRADGGYAASNSAGLWITYDRTNDFDPHAQDAAKVVIPAFSSISSSIVLASDIDSTTEQFYLTGDNSSYNSDGRTIMIDSEKMTVFDPDGSGPLQAFNRTTFLLNVKRGQNGTAAASHSAGVGLRMSTNTVPNAVRLPLGTSDGHTYLFTWDGYWTDSYLNSGLSNHKAFNFISKGIWLEPNTSFAGGIGDAKVAGFSQTDSVAAFQTRSYHPIGGGSDWSSTGGNMAGPGVTATEPLSPQLAKFVYKPNRWVRFWYLIEQRANDYDYVSAWIADENNDPVQMYNHLPISVRTNSSPANSIEEFYLEFNTSTEDYTRGNDRDFVSYVRNLAVLIDPPANISPLLVRPGNSVAIIDNTPPIISEVSVSNITSTGATITWSTNEISSSNIQYGLTTGYGLSKSSTGTTMHSVTLTGLLPGTVYYFYTRATDSSGNSVSSINQTFTTVAAGGTPTPDPTPTPPTGSSTTAVLNSNTSTNGNSPHTVTLSNVTSGNTIIVGLSQTSSAIRTYAVTDNQGNVYTPVVSTLSTGSPRFGQIFMARNVVGGSNVTITATTNCCVSLNMAVLEIGKITGVDATGVSNETIVTNSHTCSSPGINTSSEAFIFCVGTLTADGGTITPGSGYTKLGSYGQTMFQYKTSSTQLTSETGNWISSVARLGPEIFASFKLDSSIPQDTTPPTIQNLSISGVTQTGATITWTTNESSTGSIQYGLTTGYGSTLNSSGTTSHTVTLTGLLPNTTYNYHITVRDSANNTTTSTNQTFATLTSTQTTPPTTPVTPPTTGGGGGTPTVTPVSSGGGGGGGGSPQTPTIPLETTVSSKPVSNGTGTTIPGPNITRTLTVGSKGDDVSLLQAYLIHKGYMPTGRADGNFGFLTRDAVQRYQCATLQICSGSSTTNGYGLVGSKTRAALLGTPTTIPLETTVSSKPVSNGTGNIKLTRTLSFGMRGTDVTTLQTFLISKGYLTGASATGYFGPLTRQAVQKFQCDKLRICSGSSTTNGYGVVGPKTRGEMGR